MATYYRWRKYTIGYSESTSYGQSIDVPRDNDVIWYSNGKPSIVNGQYQMGNSITVNDDRTFNNTYWVAAQQSSNVCYKGDSLTVYKNPGMWRFYSESGSVEINTVSPAPGTSQGYVYSTSSSAYPNGGVQDGYYYSSRTTVTSPSAPGNISYSMNTASTSIQVSWGAASSETDYPVDHYELQRQINGGGWTTVNSNISVTSFTASLTSATTTYRFRVRAVDTNGQSGDWKTGNTGTKINAPGAPSVSAPSEAVSGESIQITWGTVSGATSYTVQRNTGGSWTQVYSGNALTFSETVGVWDSLQYRVQAVNQAGGGAWGYSGAITVYISPTLTVPQMVMQGQQATISWSAIEGADSYTLQRKSSADADWTQVYSGANLSYTETVGTWTSLQYRVQAVFDGTPGGWATSESIPVVSTSALVISGTDGDLGTVVNDIPYSISTDTGNQITATITVNGAVIFNGNVGNSVADVIPVLDLINGSGTIVIEASVTAFSGPVSAVRTWTYTKTMMTFPNAGSIAELTKDGKVMWPETLAEAVRVPGGKTLDQVMGFPCQMYTGSYVGTGAYGTGNPNELTFPFEPKIIIGITPEDDSSALTRSMIRPNQQSYVGSYSLYVTWDGNSVSWYSINGATQQLNRSGKTYYYVALG